MRLIAIALLSLAALVPSLAAAQEPPARVGRLAYVEGTVAVYQDPDIGWDQAFPNAPLTGENSVWTDPRSRAEVRLSGVALRLAEETQLDIARLDDAKFAGYVVQGSLAIRVRHHDPRNLLEISTPHGRVAFLTQGRYRLDVNPDRDETLLTVFSGTASLRAAGGDVRVDGGDAIRIFGGPDPSYEREPAGGIALDRWAQDRDALWVERVSTRYVSPYMTGYEDLDRYGEWIEEPGYGALWYPTQVSVDWVPYRDGHWTWVRPWGWTWVAAEPWGYAPFHYGRWVYVRERWCWTPGQRVERPVWAPALVAWVGGSNFSVGVGSRAAPAVGWYPLAPWERYQPWYRASNTYVTQVNVVVRNEPPREWRDNRRDIDWRTFNRERAATVVSRDVLGERRNLAQNVVQVNRQQLLQAPMVSPVTVAPREQFVRQREQQREAAPTRIGPPPMPQAPAAVQQAPAAPGALRVPPVMPGAAAPAAAPAATAPGDNRPRFERERTAPAPLPAPAPAGQRPGPGPQGFDRNGRDEHSRGDAQRTQQEIQRQQLEQQRATQEQQRQQAEQQRQSQERGSRDAQQRQQQEQQRQQAEQQRQQQERAGREAQQRQQQEQQRQQAEQQRQQQERAGREAQQRQQQEQQRAQQEQQRQQAEQQRQQQERAAREAQQRQQQEQQRAQQEQQRQQAEQQRQQQERAAREAQQRQQQEQQRAQQEQRRQLAEQQRAQQEQQRQQAEQQRQQQERAAREAQQRAQQEQQRAQQEQQRQLQLQQQQQRAQEAQQRAQQQQQQRAQPPGPSQGQPPGQERRDNRENRGRDDDKDKPGRG